jgi:hypothetical protein
MSVFNKLKKLFTKSVVEVGQTLASIKAPGRVLTVNISAGWVKVGAGNIIRIEAGADMFVAFSDSDLGATAVSVTTSPAVKLSAGYHYVICANEWVRASANPTRLELLEL